MPRRRCIRRIALVKNGEGCCKQRIAQIFVKLRELPRREQAFVNDSQRRQRTDITALRQHRLRALAQQRQPKLKFRRLARRMKRRNIKLPRLRHRFERSRPENGRVDRHPAPSKNAKSLRVRGSFNGTTPIGGLPRRKKREAQSKMLRQLDRLLRRTSAKE